MIKKTIYRFLRFTGVVLIIFLLFLFALQSLIFIQNFWPESYGLPGVVSRARVGVLEIKGPLFSADRYLEDLQRYEKRKDVKAVLLDIDSPGGAVAPIQELNEALERIKEQGKPVVAAIRSVGASGGYYLASSADTVVATPGSMVGSIGVQIQVMRIEELIDKVGIEYEVIKSGDYKDIGSPFREMSADEREVLRHMIMDVYDQFIEHIVQNREQLGRARVEEIADGSIFTGRQAYEKGLVDMVGTKNKALHLAGEAAGIEERPAVVEPRRQPAPLWGEQAAQLLDSVAGIFPRDDRSVRLLYMMSNWSHQND